MHVCINILCNQNVKMVKDFCLIYMIWGGAVVSSVATIPRRRTHDLNLVRGTPRQYRIESQLVAPPVDSAVMSSCLCRSGVLVVYRLVRCKMDLAPLLQ